MKMRRSSDVTLVNMLQGRRGDARAAAASNLATSGASQERASARKLDQVYTTLIESPYSTVSPLLSSPLALPIRERLYVAPGTSCPCKLLCCMPARLRHVLCSNSREVSGSNGHANKRFICDDFLEGCEFKKLDGIPVN